MKIKIPKISKRVSLREKINLTRNLGVMLETGLPLSTSLTILSKQARGKTLKRAILQIGRRIQDGETLANSLTSHQNIFSPFYISVIRLGEESGNLQSSLKELAKQMSKTSRLQAQIKGALIYPAVILVSMMVIGVVMLTVIVPRIKAVFEQFELSLPLSTRFIILVSELLSDYLLLTILVALSVVIFINWYLKKEAGQRLFYYLLMKLPILNRLHQDFNSALFSRNLSSLIIGGVHIAKALEITADTHRNIYYKNAMNKAAREVQKGRTLHEIIREYPKLYPPMVVEILEVGEETGELNSLLSNLAEFYEEEVDQTTKNLSVIIEPALLLTVGVAVGFFAVSMLQPMYSILQGFS